MPNRLVDATSPYLLQHKDNPVEWYEWGTEAFSEATRRDVPVLLSVGYSACHWCHVMAHESFEDEETAEYMNAQFVNVKVDREERPDIDRIYMDAVTSMSGRGGWPMTVFLMPDQKPIFAGTYFPKNRMSHHPSFMDVMGAVKDAWNTNRSGVLEQANNITAAIAASGPPPGGTPTMSDLEEAVRAIERIYDSEHGGFGGAPKFPQAPTLEFLLRTASLRPSTETGATALMMLTGTLERMARGGIYDHLYGGFARYSVDAIWLVPHFEKMLYDNALLARIYLRTWQVTGDERFRSTAIEVLDYLDRAMADPIGGIHSAEDADSEGIEGKFAIWSWDELRELLGDDLGVAAAIYGFTQSGNFEGANIPTRETPLAAVANAQGMSVDELEKRRNHIDEVLITARQDREPPGRDDKLVTAWNGFALRAFAEAAAVLSDDRYLRRAEAIAGYLSGPASPGGSLIRSWRGRPGVGAFADDLASAAIGWYALFQVSGDTQWYQAAEAAVQELRSNFRDTSTGGFFATSNTADRLISRPKNIQDNPTPSDNALAMEALQLHAAFSGDLAAIEEMETTMRALSVVAKRHPAFGGQALAVWLTHLVGVKEVAVTGPIEATDGMQRLLWDAFRPNVIVAVNRTAESSVPLLADRPAGEEAAAYVCERHVCGLPARSADDLASQLAV